MQTHKKDQMMKELNEILATDVYDTPKEKKRVFLDKLFLGTRAYFLIRYVSMIVRMAGKAKRDDFHKDELLELGFTSMGILEDVGAKFHIEGLDNIRKVQKEPVVFVGNHMSTLETMVFPCVVEYIKPVVFVVKKSLITFPIFGHIMKASKPIAVGRVNPREDLKTVMEEGKKVLESGVSVIVFQQSHRNPNFDPETFSSLGIKLAQKSGVKVVPFALKTDFWGNAKKLRDFGPIRRKEPVHFSFGEPIAVENLGKDTNEKIIKFIEEKLEKWGHNPDKNSL